MTAITDQSYLRTDQYKDATNLDARVQLHVRFSTNPQQWFDWVFDQFATAAVTNVLELGGGPGYLWRDCADRVPAHWQITLSDYSPGMVAEARRNLAPLQRSFRCLAIDAQAVPFADQQFDAVIANHMFFHLPDRQRAFADIRRVLRPSGTLYATTVGAGHLHEMYDLLHRFDPTLTNEADEPGHTFLAENGGEQLAPWFDHVELRRYNDELQVTEAAPLVAFIRSGWRYKHLDDHVFADFTRFVEQELAQQNGVIRIRKTYGMFVATR